MGRPRIRQGSPPVPTYAAAESSPAAPSSPTAATPGLFQWSLVEATFVTAATTCCLLAVLGCLQPAEQEDPTHFTVNGFSAGSHTGAVIASAIRCLWPASQITARLGAIAMPKSVLAALVATFLMSSRQLGDGATQRHDGF